MFSFPPAVRPNYALTEPMLPMTGPMLEFPMPGPNPWRNRRPTQPRPPPERVLLLPSDHPNLVYAQYDREPYRLPPAPRPGPARPRWRPGNIFPGIPRDRVTSADNPEDEDLTGIEPEPMDIPQFPLTGPPAMPLAGPNMRNMRNVTNRQNSQPSQTDALPNDDHLKGMGPEILPNINDESSFDEIKEEYR